MTLEQAKELLKHIQENPESLKQFEELAKAAQKDPHAQPIFSSTILKPSDKDSVVLNPNYKKPLEKDPQAKPIFSEEIVKPSKKNIAVLSSNVKKPLKNAEDSKQTEMEMSPQDHEKKRVGELAKRIKACIEKMQMDKMSKESMDKDDKPHAPGTPEDKAHDVAEEGESVKEAVHDLKDKSAGSKEELLSHLRSLKDKSQLRSPENREAGKESHEKAELEKQLMSPPFSMTEKSEGYYRDLVKRCWEGYEPTPGKKAYSKGSCRPIKKQQIEPTITTKIVPPVIPSGSGNGGSKPKKPFKKPLMNSELEKESLQAVPKKVLVEEMSGDPKERGSLKQHSYWKAPGKESNYPRTKFPAAASDKMRLVDMMTGKYKMHGPKGVLKIEKAQYYENLIKSIDLTATKEHVPTKQEKRKSNSIYGKEGTSVSERDKKLLQQKGITNPTRQQVNEFRVNRKYPLKNLSVKGPNVGVRRDVLSLIPTEFRKEPLLYRPLLAWDFKDWHKLKLEEIKNQVAPNLPKKELQKFEYYQNLVKSTLEKAKIIAGPGRSEKLGTVLGQMNTEDYTSKDNVKDQKSVRLFHESKNNPTKENISAFHESQKIKLPVKETDKKVGQLAEGVENRYFSRKQGKKNSIKDKKPFVSPKKVKTKNTFLEENKNPETLGKTQKVLVGGRVIYTDRAPDGPHQVLVYKIKGKEKSRKKRKPKKTKVRKSEQHYQDLIKKILDN